MISKDYKCVFIHIHKTAGTSIETHLGFYKKAGQIQDHRTIQDISNISNKYVSLKNGVYSLRKGSYKPAFIYFKNVLKPELTKAEFNSYYKFCFVRNSWDRLYSWYANVMRDEKHKKAYNIQGACSLKKFVKEKLPPQRFNQLSFITNAEGDIPMDFIGRFENLNQDFSVVCNELGIQNSQLPEILVSGNNHYSNYYDGETIDLVYKLYKKEIDYFEFEFDKK